MQCLGVAGLCHRQPPSSISIISKYFFHLALENSAAPDYVTEKVYLALMAGAVPVYSGAPDGSVFFSGLVL